MPAESSETRQSSIVGVLMVRVNGKIVYDMRPAANMAAENAKFLEHHRFYYGAEDQMPDPTMEAISGVGNTPAYRGVMTMVARDVNLFDYGDAIPTYEFVLVGEGEVVETETTFLQAPAYGRFINAEWPLADTEQFYTYVGTRDTPSGSSDTYASDSVQDVLDHLLGAYPGTPGVYLGYSASSASTIGGGAPDGLKISNIDTPLDVTLNTSLLLIYNNVTPAELVDSDPTQAELCAFIPPAAGPGNWYQDNVGNLVGFFPDESDPNYRTFVGCPSDGNRRGIPPVYIQVKRRRPPVTAATGDPCILGVPVILPDAPGFQVDCAGTVTPIPEYSLDTINGYDGLQQEIIDTVIIGGQANTVYQQLTLGPILEPTDPAGTEEFWTAAYDAAVARGDMPAGLVYGVDYPVTVSEIYVGQIVTEELVSNALSVATAIERICIRGGLQSGDIDTVDIDATLHGYPIQADYNAADDIKPLLAYCSAFASEYDGKIHFHPYGEAIEVVIDPEDFVEGSDVTDDGSREQAKEYPRKLSVNSIDITQNYTVRPQYAYRNTPDVRAIGEETIQIPLCDTPDHTAQIAEIAIKVSYARMQGTRKFSVPYVGYDTYLKLVPGMPFALDGKRWVANRIMLEDGVMAIEAAYDRQSAYTSTATGVPALPPTPPDSTIGGVTLFAAMNIAALRDQDDKLILYFAVAGLLPSWPGCLLQWSVDDGASWQTAIASMTQSSVIGFLTAPLAEAAAEGDDVTNELKVQVHGGQLNSITYTQYLNELNPCAILRPDSTAEIIQFLDADETSPDAYTLTTLARGRLGSETTAHAQGARFCGLDSVYSLEIPSSYRGRTILFRPVTFGTAPENNATYSLVYDPAVSQTELAPQGINSEIVGSLLRLTVYPRHRFGTSVFPVASTNMLGYRWDVTDGVNNAHSETSSPETVADITGWSSPITVSVSQINRFTGPGPALEVIL